MATSIIETELHTGEVTAEALDAALAAEDSVWGELEMPASMDIEALVQFEDYSGSPSVVLYRHITTPSGPVWAPHVDGAHVVANPGDGVWASLPYGLDSRVIGVILWGSVAGSCKVYAVR